MSRALGLKKALRSAAAEVQQAAFRTGMAGIAAIHSFADKASVLTNLRL
jgi:hypothetical protein